MLTGERIYECQWHLSGAVDSNVELGLQGSHKLLVRGARVFIPNGLQFARVDQMLGDHFDLVGPGSAGCGATDDGMKRAREFFSEQLLYPLGVLFRAADGRYVKLRTGLDLAPVGKGVLCIREVEVFVDPFAKVRL